MREYSSKSQPTLCFQSPSSYSLEDSLPRSPNRKDSFCDIHLSSTPDDDLDRSFFTRRILLFSFLIHLLLAGLFARRAGTKCLASCCVHPLSSPPLARPVLRREQRPSSCPLASKPDQRLIRYLSLPLHKATKRRPRYRLLRTFRDTSSARVAFAPPPPPAILRNP